jgi:hypothetical protein
MDDRVSLCPATVLSPAEETAQMTKESLSYLPDESVPLRHILGAYFESEMFRKL